MKKQITVQEKVSVWREVVLEVNFPIKNKKDLEKAIHIYNNGSEEGQKEEVEYIETGEYMWETMESIEFETELCEDHDKGPIYFNEEHNP